jgi:hypothetical protein
VTDPALEKIITGTEASWTYQGFIKVVQEPGVVVHTFNPRI